MKWSIFCCEKFKLLILVVVSFLWSFFIFFVLNSSLIISTLWLRNYVQIYYYIAVVFSLVAILKGRGKLNKVNRLKTYAKGMLYAFVITVHVAHAIFCGWVVYMVLDQSILLAAITGSIQVMVNISLLFVRDLPHGSIG